jgi:dihydrodipicolinate synthase/N-acetylneuraminate lyase
MSKYRVAADWVRRRLLAGCVIPAHPLALDPERRLDEQHQRALTRYYAAAGAGGVAVGVHTTQFEIRDPRHGLLKPVLQLAAETLDSCEPAGAPLVRIAGICGPTVQALREAELARACGYHLGLLSLGGVMGLTLRELVQHAAIVARTIPLFCFYLQPAVGGRPLPYSFWREVLNIPNVAAIKVAPFDRYQTLDVMRALAESGRSGEIALFTGNDDNIVSDLASDWELNTESGTVSLGFRGGLLGHWAFWTRRAVELLQEAQRAKNEPARYLAGLLRRAQQVTEVNAAVFDARHNFRGCVPGINEMLRRQGLMRGRWCLDAALDLSPGQEAEIQRVCRLYPELSDDAFVRDHLESWLS